MKYNCELTENVVRIKILIKRKKNILKLKFKVKKNYLIRYVSCLNRCSIFDKFRFLCCVITYTSFHLINNLVKKGWTEEFLFND